MMRPKPRDTGLLREMGRREVEVSNVLDTQGACRHCSHIVIAPYANQIHVNMRNTAYEYNMLILPRTRTKI